MALRSTIKILIIAVLLYSCYSNHDDKKFEEQAYKSIHLLDTTTLRYLQNWDYGQRGEAEVWSKILGDSSIFICFYYPSPDKPRLRTYRIAPFLNYFKSDLKIDTSYHTIQLTKIGRTDLNLVKTNNNGEDILVPQKLSLLKIFPEQNPFDTFSKLTELKNKLNVIGISHNNKLGGFIQFYFPDRQHVLTYLPDTLLNSDNFNKFWKTEFLKGKILKPGWNFRKLENPIDGG